MAKAQPGTAKFQSKQIKLSGLQKLKFYCQICTKQCRDANGFKNHLASPSHLGRVQAISESGKGSQMIEKYSREFKHEFLRLLRINHGTKKINANKFYQEYILNDREGVHMNSTRWGSLTLFMKELGKGGDVRVEGEIGGDEEVTIALVDRQKVVVKEKTSKTEDEVMRRRLEEQIKKGKENQQRYEKSNENSELETVKNIEVNGANSVNLLTPTLAPVKLSLKNVCAKRTTKAPSAFANDSDSEEEEIVTRKKTNIGNISRKLFNR